LDPKKENSWWLTGEGSWDPANAPLKKKKKAFLAKGKRPAIMGELLPDLNPRPHDRVEKRGRKKRGPMTGGKGPVKRKKRTNAN